MTRLTRWFRFASAARLATQLIALGKLLRHPQTPRLPKLVALAVLAYALSPIDLIPDFIPVLGQLDDLLLVPLGVALVVWLTPKPLWQALLAEAQASSDKLPTLRWGAAGVIVVWLVLLALFAGWLWHVLAAA